MPVPKNVRHEKFAQSLAKGNHNVHVTPTALDATIPVLLKPNALLEEMKFPLSTWSEWEHSINEKGRSASQISKLADAWITENKEQLAQWVGAVTKVTK